MRNQLIVQFGQLRLVKVSDTIQLLEADDVRVLLCDLFDYPRCSVIKV